MLHLSTGLPVDNGVAVMLSTKNYMVDRQSHAFSSNLEIIVHAIIKIILGFASYNFNFCLVLHFTTLVEPYHEIHV